jgi:hypothetical protein
MTSNPERGDPNSWEIELKLAKQSGFPLQMALDSVVQANSGQHGWRVATHEHPWSLHGHSGFVDIVLEKRIESCAVRLAVECKKRKEQLLFFCPRGSSGQEARAKLRWGYRESEKVHPGGWAEVHVVPASYESEFCSVGGEGDAKRRSMLEGVAHDTSLAAEGVCNEELQLRENEPMGTALVYVPIIVTTADLVVCHLDPSAVSLDTGLAGTGHEFERVPYIRFRKALSAEDANLKFARSLDESRASSERTVFVVAADQLSAFLGAWDVQPPPNEQIAGKQLPWVALRDRIDHEDREEWMRQQLK